MGLTKPISLLAGHFNEWRERKGVETLSDWLQTHSHDPALPAGWPSLKLDRIAMTRDVALLDSVLVGDLAAQTASDLRPNLALTQSDSMQREAS